MARSDLSTWLSVLVLGAACSPAYADRIAVEAAAKPVAVPAPVESPYEVDLIGEDGQALETYQHRGKFYVLGTTGERYAIRVTNPTNQRVEAVLSVDGLDVIDGETADFVHKRGYVVPAGGELRVEGFRVSTSHVATFRFSSVKNSYAGRKGKARNVGVVGVAIFAERPQPQVVMPAPVEERRHVHWDEPDYDYRDDAGGAPRGGAADKTAERSEAEEPAAPPPAQPSATGLGGSVSRAPAKPAPPARHRYRDTVSKRECCGAAKPKERPGLGTEFGERRYSAVSFTRFERANPTKPTALAEFRYNDRDGLLALGIQLPPLVDPDEISTRETADPFPASSFSNPPAGWR